MREFLVLWALVTALAGAIPEPHRAVLRDLVTASGRLLDHARSALESPGMRFLVKTAASRRER